ncbi:MAG TPA: hypothetical protein VKH45_08870 [Candidatus Acidoferrum sp.]|nr:hypothetical protein [Candidatus Acidoferrum sp.]
MNRNHLPFKLGTLLGTLLLISVGSTHTQQKATPAGASAAGSAMATFTVTVVGKKDAPAPPIALDDVQLFSGKDRKQIGEWKKGDKLYLAILIDDSIENAAGGQWDYLREFILAQPPTTYVALGYIRNNTTMVAQDFTDNHELVTKALRIPLGISALGSSPYLGTMDMLKRWPETGLRRSVILISSGIDYFRGTGFGTFSPDLDPLIQRAERQNTNVWSIYYPSSGHRGKSFYLTTNGQNNLDKLAEDSGAESYFLGTQAPVSLKPYLDEITQHLGNQYLLSFAASGGNKGKYQSVKVKTDLKDVEFFTPAAAYIPPSK